jgi:hypothetical protein
MLKMIPLFGLPKEKHFKSENDKEDLYDDE